MTERLGVKIIFRPQYSPKFTLIEHAWNTLKTEIRSKRPRTFEMLIGDVQKKSKIFLSNTLTNGLEHTQ